MMENLQDRRNSSREAFRVALGGSRIAPWKDRQELFRRSWKDRKRQPGQDRERHTKPGMIIHTWNPRWTWRWRQKDQEGKANLGNTATGNSV